MHLAACFARIVAFTTLAAVSTGQPCNPYPFRPSMLPPCDTIGSKVANAVAATIAVKQAIAEFNERIYQARQRFWAVYPDGPGYAEAEEQFLLLLLEKNFNLLQTYVASGMTGDLVTKLNVLGFGPGVTVEQYRQRLRGDFNLLDGGLNPPARPLFVQWVNTLRREAGAQKDGDLVINPMVMANALYRPTSRRRAYERAQFWAEILASGVDLKKYFTPELYIQLTMETRVSIELGNAQTADIPDCQAATVALYQTLVQLMGAKEVANAAAAVFAAPKSAWGDLATSTDVDIGNHQTATYEPYLRFLDLLAGSSPRAYAITLLLDQYQLNSAYSTKGKWIAAAGEYDQRVKKFGEPAVLAAAMKVMTARKSANGGMRGDPQYRPVNAWFELALTDPKTVVPDGNLPHFKASSYSSRWLGKHLAVRGTVARVNVDAGGQPVYATIYFKESPDNKIVAFTPYSKSLQGQYGNDFAGLVGAPVEIYGNVQEWHAGAGVRVLDVRQIAVVKGGFGPDDGDSNPDWLNAPEPTLVENPKYAAWRKFPAGTKVTQVSRLYTESQPGTDQYARTTTGRTVFTLKSIDDKRAVVVVASTARQMNGQQLQAPDREDVYNAKVLPPPSPPVTPNESGAETIEISGRKFATHWSSIQGQTREQKPKPDPERYVKTWVSDDVPGGLVREVKKDHSNMPVYSRLRNMSETIIEAVEGIEPELGALKADAPKSTLIVSSRNMEEIRKAYAALGERATALKEGIRDWQKARRYIRPPVKIEDAVMGADVEIRKIWPAITRNNVAMAETAMKATEEKLDVIEQFLKTGEVPSEPKAAAPAKAPAANKAVVPKQTPPPPNRRVDAPSVAPPTTMTAAEWARQYGALATRVRQAKMGLIQRQQAGLSLPADVSSARDRLDTELVAAGRAQPARDAAQAEQSLRTVEATLAVIEQFLSRQSTR